MLEYIISVILYMFYVFQCEMNLDTGEPTDTLAPLAKQLIENLGSHSSTVSSIIDSKDKAVFTAITEGLDRANKCAISQAQKVKLYIIMLYMLYACVSYHS